MSGSLSPDQAEIGAPSPVPPAPTAAATPVITMPRPAEHDDEDPPTGSTDRDLLYYMLRKADKKRDEQIEATRDLAKAMTAHNEGAAARHQSISDGIARAPGRLEFRALGAALVALVFWLIALYAQALGQDAGKAARDARAALPYGSPSSEPAANVTAPQESP